MIKKESKRKFLLQFADKFKNEWAHMTYEEIRKLIFNDYNKEVTIEDIRSVCCKIGAYRDKDRVKQKSKSHWGDIQQHFYTKGFRGV